MIHNHMLRQQHQQQIDPESSPVRGYGHGTASSSSTYGARPAPTPSGFDDPWYTSSGPPSPATQAAPPAAAAPGQSVFSFGGFGAPPPYSAPMGGYGMYGAPPADPAMDFDDYDNEPPLLEELGINFDHITKKTQAVLYINKAIDEHILDDTDLAGPLVFCLALGGALLLSGKVHFGYIYGFSVFGCLGLQGIVSLMHPVGLDFWRTCSVLGYCLLPVIFLAVLAIVLNLNSLLGLILSAFAIAWSTVSATRLIDAKLQLTEQYWLVLYPVMLLYSCFVLITIF